MSYWVWLGRMILFGLMSGVSVTFLLRLSPSRQIQSDRVVEDPKAIAVDIEKVLPSEYSAVRHYTPITNLPTFPDPKTSRLTSIVDSQNSAAIANRSLPDLPKPAPVIPKSIKPVQSPETAKASPEAKKETNTQSKSDGDRASQSQPSSKSSSKSSPRSSSKSSSKTNRGQNYTQVATTSKPRSSFNLEHAIERHTPLFSSPVALGMLAIGAAEGNYHVFAENGTLYVERTSNYFGHTDPGNLSWGERVTNYGPCSDQGRSHGNIKVAERMCSQRALKRLPTNLIDLYNAGIDPNEHLEAVLNTADLYNQASPVHSRRFPQALAIAKEGGLHGLEAIAWARTASFYLNSQDKLDLTSGRNRASGLLGICSRERRGVTEWECVYRDQMRRVKEIALVLDKYLLVYKPQ